MTSGEVRRTYSGRLVCPAIYREEMGEERQWRTSGTSRKLSCPSVQCSNCSEPWGWARVIKCNQGTECSELPAFSSHSPSSLTPAPLLFPSYVPRARRRSGALSRSLARAPAYRTPVLSIRHFIPNAKLWKERS